MKKMMMALAALCVAGAASAVTWSWTNADTSDLTMSGTKGGDTFRETADLSGKIGEATQWAIQCTMTLGSDYALSNSGYPVLVGIGGTDSDNDPRFIIVKNSNDIKWSSGVLGGDDIDSNVDAAASGEYTIRFECAKVEGGTTVSVYLNGSEVTTFTYARTDADFRKITWGAQKDSGGTSNQLDDWTSWTVSNVQYAVPVPEPTALALLALGVAGLALRRKAA